MALNHFGGGPFLCTDYLLVIGAGRGTEFLFRVDGHVVAA